MKREAYAPELKWKVSDLYKSDDDFLQALKKFEESLANYAKYQNHILDSADNLFKF